MSEREGERESLLGGVRGSGKRVSRCQVQFSAQWSDLEGEGESRFTLHSKAESGEEHVYFFLSFVSLYPDRGRYCDLIVRWDPMNGL